MNRYDEPARPDTSEGRHSKRLQSAFPVKWRILYTNITGQGVIKNLSADGLCVQLDQEFTVHPGALIMTFEAPDLPALPPAKIRWFRRPTPPGETFRGFRLGLAFLEAPAELWAQWYRDALADPPKPA